MDARTSKAVGVAALVTVLPSLCWGQVTRLPVEEWMREFQARAVYVSGVTVNWPDSIIDSSCQPNSPDYPADGYYDAEFASADHAKTLVGQLAAIWESPLPGTTTALAKFFVKDSDLDLTNRLSGPENFSLGDFDPLPAPITESNYEAAFFQLQTNLDRLKGVERQAYLTGTGMMMCTGDDDLEVNVGEGSGRDAECADAYSQAVGSLTYSGWHCPGANNISILEQLYWTQEQEGDIQIDVIVTGVRGRFKVDLSNDNGTAAFFVKVINLQDGGGLPPSNYNPPSPATGLFGSFGSPITGIEWTSPVAGDLEMIAAPLAQCGNVNQVPHYAGSGWRVAEWVAIVQPDFRSFVCGTFQSDCDGDGASDLCDFFDGVGDIDLNGVPDTCQCRGDANSDGIVDVIDLNTVLGNFSRLVPIGHDGDVTFNCVVDIQDLNVVIANLGLCSPLE